MYSSIDSCSTDPDALQTKLFLLLQTERYGAALELPGCDGFEKAYALYRMQKGDEAREVLKEVTGDAERGATHLEAQLVRQCSLPSRLWAHPYL